MSSIHPMSNSEPESGLQPDPTWKSNPGSTSVVLGTNSTSTPSSITTSTSNNSILTSIATATPTLTHDPRSGPGPGPRPGLGSASRPAHQAPVVSLPVGTTAFASSSSGAQWSFDPPANRSAVRPHVVGEVSDTGIGMDMDVQFDGQREVDQGQGKRQDRRQVQRQRQDELLQEEDQVQRGQPQREDELERQSDVSNLNSRREVAEREVEEKKRDLRSQTQSQKDCEHIRVNGIQGR